MIKQSFIILGCTIISNYLLYLTYEAEIQSIKSHTPMPYLPVALFLSIVVLTSLILHKKENEDLRDNKLVIGLGLTLFCTTVGWTIFYIIAERVPCCGVV